MTKDIHHELGSHDARLDALEATSNRIEAKLDEALKALAISEGRRHIISASVALIAAGAVSWIVALVKP